MSFKKLVIPVSLAAMLAVGATPALAQRGGGGHGGGGGGHSGGGGHYGGGGHSGGGHQHGGYGGGGHAGGHADGHQGGGVHHGGTPGGLGHGGFGHGGFHGNGFGHYGHPFAHVHYRNGFRGPFFAFRPRFDLGFGLFIGYPFVYPWDYIEPYPYVMYDPYGPAVPGDGYVNGNATGTQDDDNGAAGATTDDPEALRHYGGVSLDVTPGDASVFVDNDYAGQVMKYGPTQAPLTLAPGSHRIVISKPGYKTMTFDSDVLEGQVVPYQGKMQKADQSEQPGQTDQPDQSDRP
jgi:hypothetical protein